jgi:hypothetical protein
LRIASGERVRAQRSPVNVDELRRRAALGQSATLIGLEMDYPRETIQRCAKRHGITLADARPYHHPDEWKPLVAQLIADFEAGFTYGEIAGRLSIAAGRTITKNQVLGKLDRLDRIGERLPRQVKQEDRVVLPPPGHCMFPVDAGYCAEPCESRGAAYCAEHRRVVYRKAAPVDMRVAA